MNGTGDELSARAGLSIIGNTKNGGIAGLTALDQFSSVRAVHPRG